MSGEFKYRGYTLAQLTKMSMDDFIKLLPARQRRSLRKGLYHEQKVLLERIRKLRQVQGQEKVMVKTECRDLVILPEMVGVTIQIHDGKTYIPIKIRPETIGRYLGELAITNKKVEHGTPGLKATRSSMYVPLK